MANTVSWAQPFPGVSVMDTPTPIFEHPGPACCPCDADSPSIPSRSQVPRYGNSRRTRHAATSRDLHRILFQASGAHAFMLMGKSEGGTDMLANPLEDGIPAIDRASPVDSDAAWLSRLERMIGHTLFTLQAGLWEAVTLLDLQSALVQVAESRQARPGGVLITRAIPVGRWPLTAT